MRNPRFQLLAKVLLASALLMFMLGLYLLLAKQNVVAGGALIFVAVSDVVIAMVFSRRAS